MVLLVVAAVQWPTLASAQAKRIALVIGNKGYVTAVGPLKNPHNDITLVADALRAADFEVLEPVREATRAGILAAVRLFALRLQGAGPDAVGFLYYSGHGAAIGSQNYLIPVDVDKPDSASLADGGVPQREIINRLAEIAPNAVHYLVIDACRNNLGGTKGPKGLRAENRRDGMLIAFAASPDKPASDEGETSGPFAAALAAELAKPERDDYLLFHNVRVAVDRVTRGEQVPWIEDGMRRAERVKLGIPSVLGSQVKDKEGARELPWPQASTQQQAGLPSASEAAQTWFLIKDTTSISILRIYVARFPGSVFAELARVRISELGPSSERREPPTQATVPQRPVAAATPPSSAGAPPPPAVHGVRKTKLYAVTFAPDGKLEQPPYTGGTIRGDFAGYAGNLVRDDRGTFEIKVTDVNLAGQGSLQHECTGGVPLSRIKVGDIVRMKPSNCTMLHDYFVTGAAFDEPVAVSIGRKEVRDSNEPIPMMRLPPVIKRN